MFRRTGSTPPLHPSYSSQAPQSSPSAGQEDVSRATRPAQSRHETARNLPAMPDGVRSSTDPQGLDLSKDAVAGELPRRFATDSASHRSSDSRHETQQLVNDSLPAHLRPKPSDDDSRTRKRKRPNVPSLSDLQQSVAPRSSPAPQQAQAAAAPVRQPVSGHGAGHIEQFYQNIRGQVREFVIGRDPSVRDDARRYVQGRIADTSRPSISARTDSFYSDPNVRLYHFPMYALPPRLERLFSHELIATLPDTCLRLVHEIWREAETLHPSVLYTNAIEASDAKRKFIAEMISLPMFQIMINTLSMLEQRLPRNSEQRKNILEDMNSLRHFIEKTKEYPNFRAACLDVMARFALSIDSAYVSSRTNALANLPGAANPPA